MDRQKTRTNSYYKVTDRQNLDNIIVSVKDEVKLCNMPKALLMVKIDP